MKKIITLGESNIAKEFFKKYTNSSTVKDILYPESRSDKLGVVQRAFAKLNNKGYINEERLCYNKIHEKGPNKGKEYFQAGPKFILNLNIFFDYLEEKEVKLSQNEKNYFNLILSNSPIRETICELFPEDHIIDAFLKFWLRFLVLPCALKENYLENIDSIEENKKNFDMVNEFLLNHSKKYKKDLKKVIENPTKISNTNKITKICRENLKNETNPKIIKHLNYSKMLLRSSYLTKHEDSEEGKFIKRLNQKIMKGFGIEVI